MPVDDPHLQRAQDLLAQGDYRTALQEYRALADRGEHLDALIEQLEQIQVDRQNRPVVRQLLGDIYLRNGQHQKALDIYRDALEMF